MDHWKTRFEEHAVHEALNLLLANTDPKKSKLKDDAELRGLDRFRQVVSLVQRRLAEADPRLITNHLLDGLYQAANNANSDASSFFENKNWQSLNDKADELLKRLTTIPVNSPEPIQTSTKQIEEYRSAVSQAIQQLKEQKAELSKSFIEIKSSFVDLQKKIKSNAQVAEEQKKRIDQFITQNTDNFSSTQAKRQEEYDGLKAKWDAEASGTFDNFKENASKLIEQESEQFENERKLREEHHQRLFNEVNKRSDDVISGLNERLKKAKEIVGKISVSSISGHYRNTADSEGKAALAWRLLAFAGFLVVAAVVIWIALTFKDTSVDWRIILFRMSAAVLVALPAGYAAKQASRHAKSADEMRRFQLELAAIHPYLDRLPKEQADQILATLSDRYFAGHSIVDDSTNTDAKRSLLAGGELAIKAAKAGADIVAKGK